MVRNPRATTAITIAGASVVLGAAAWASRAVLDEVVADGIRQRVALVPSWHTALAFTVLGLMAGASAYRALAGRRAGRPMHDAADLALPVFGLALLLVPYLPGLPDRWPLVQVLAGPAKWIVWAVVGGQCLWVAAPHAVALRAWIARRSVLGLTVAVGLATALAAGLTASRLTYTVLFPSGDEPHYLVIAQSLWRDGDLKIENNHARGDYLEYFGRELDPHYLRRGVDEEIYSIHPIGMPLIVTPVFALGGYPLTVAFFILMGAAAAAVVWRWVVETTDARGPATLAWAAIAFSAPFLINTFTIYPEVPAAFVMALALPIVLRPTPDRRALARVGAWGCWPRRCRGSAPSTRRCRRRWSRWLWRDGGGRCTAPRRGPRCSAPPSRSCCPTCWDSRRGSRSSTPTGARFLRALPTGP